MTLLFKIDKLKEKLNRILMISNWIYNAYNAINYLKNYGGLASKFYKIFLKFWRGSSQDCRITKIATVLLSQKFDR